MSSLNTGRPLQINIDYTAGNLTADGHKAVTKKVEQLEAKNARVPQTNIAGASTVLTGATPYKVYAFTMTVNFTTGVYDFVFVEEAPNVESLS
jgi:uncharacterized protein with GYD domain